MFKQKGFVLVAVLVSISLLSLVILAGLTDSILNERSNAAYAQALQARRHCEQLANNALLQSHFSYTERLLKAQPCAMVSSVNQEIMHPVRFWIRSYPLASSLPGICTLVIAIPDWQENCSKPAYSVQPGLQTWYWHFASDAV